MEPTMTDHHTHLAVRDTDDPLFLAYALARYATHESLTDLGLANRLGCTVEKLTNLRLCWMPRAGRMWKGSRRNSA
jgi:hypothetical protein